MISNNNNNYYNNNNDKFLNSTIWSIDETLRGFTTPGESGLRSNGTEEVLHISQIPTTGASLLDAVKYLTQDTRWVSRSYTFAKFLSVYSKPPADRAYAYVLSL